MKKIWLTDIFVVTAVSILLITPALADGNPEVAKGKTAYKQLCAQCHGPNMINAGNSSFDLRKFPADQFERFEQSVTKGKGDMPAWGDMLVPGELESLWAYVSTSGES